MPDTHSDAILEYRFTRRGLFTAACGTGLFGKNGSQELLVHAGRLALAFRIGGTGLVLTRITNRATGFEHLASASQLFAIACGTKGTWRESGKDFRIERAHRSERALIITGRLADSLISFGLFVVPEARNDLARIKLKFRNEGMTKAVCRVRAPWIQGLRTRGRDRPMKATLPQEAAGVVSTEHLSANLGMRVNEKLGLPNAMNTMEVFSLYDPDDHGGVFFADAEADLDIGVAPIQFTFISDTVCGHSLVDLNPGEWRELPAFVIGVHDTGDWHHAVDDYCCRHRRHWRFPDTPAWFREQGAIYSFSGSGGGAIYMTYPRKDLASRIASFEQLPSLLAEGLSLGTNILYLWDYWEGTSNGGKPPYWNKGDYIPRSDLGGARALREGIRRIHERGGRIILYVEPFIVFWYSHVGEEKGPQWAGRDTVGNLYHQYPQNYSMVSCFQPWQEYVTGIATKLVRDFGADGIYLDSWGWQLNWPMQTAEEKILYSPLQYSLGVLGLAKRVRQAIRTVKPDAIVMGESTSGALGRYLDGGLSADFAWLRPQNQGRVLGSPVRYGMPEMNIFSNGSNLNELNQIFAAGHHLALLDANLPHADYIRKLVKLRQEYKDALIYGQQLFQPRTESDAVTAYYYRGEVTEVITVCNHGLRNYEGKLFFGAAKKTSRWQDLLSSNVVNASNGSLAIHVPAGSLLVLARRRAGK